MIIAYKNKNAEERRVFRRNISIVLLICQFISYGLWSFKKKTLTAFDCPCSLCFYTTVFCIIDGFKTNHILRSYVLYVGMWGALAAYFLNDATMPFFNIFTLEFFFYHLIISTYPIMLLIAGELRLNHKDIPNLFLLLCNIAWPIFLFDRMTMTNHMLLRVPLNAFPMTYFYKWFGNPGYIFGFVLCLFLIWFFIYIPKMIIYLYRKI